MAEADRLRLAARQESDYAGFGYAPLLDDDLRAIAAVAGDVAASALAAENSAAAADASAAVAAAGAVAAVNTTLNGLVTTATTQATSASNSAVTANTQAGIATTQATAAETSRAQAEGAVASVTVGSTNSLAYPEQVRSLVTATDVVDVMIYDTRLDSDGGAWTERCTGTSWFNEALNTASRGAKRAFPKVALIVARQTSLTIYDALELDGSSVPRMWMVFNGGSDNVMLRVINSVTPVTEVKALNGKLYRGVFHASRAFVMIDFAEDTALTANSNSGVLTKNFIATRNDTALAWVPSTGLYPTFNTGSSLDVRVLPGAPLSRVTGLPIPTVVGATSINLVVAHPTGEQTARGALVTLAGGYSRARFTADNRIVAIGAASPAIADVGRIPYAATVANTAWRTHRIGASSIEATGGVILPEAGGASPLTDVVDGAVGQQRGLSLIAEDAGNAPNSMVASIGPAHNSGWMPSTGIQLATLADGATGSVTGTTIYNNTGASLDGVASTGGATIALNAGRIEATNTSGSNGGISIPVTLVVGQTYTLECQTERIAGTVGTLVISFGAAVLVSEGINVGVKQQIIQFVAQAASGAVNIRFGGGGQSVTDVLAVDNIRLVLVASDRSYQQRGLDIVGTLNRTAVGTGNDVVGWGGWSDANYLTQPPNAALAVGTGDVLVAGWVNVSSFAAAFPVALAQGADAIQLGVGTGGFNFRLQSSTAATDLTITGTTQPVNQWVFVVGLRRAGVMELWVNGAREAALAAAGTLTATPGALDIGRSANASVMSLAMFRIAAFAPTPAQIERMFRDERALFQPGVRAFLGGASTATVRRIARSRFSSRLAVAMSDGLAVFDGLQRVEHHTTATLSPAMASNSVTPVSMESGLLLIGTTANAGVRRDAVIGLDRLPANQPSPASPRIFRARGVTTDATPLTIAPRIHIGERETVVVTALIVARVYGASDTQRLTYERRATYFRDAGGNVTLAGAVQVVGTDVEVTGTADATLVIDTTAQTVAAQVTGIAATRLVWTVRYRIERTTHDTTYEEVV